MPLLHCVNCHHEWEGEKSSKCNWCGGGSYILEPKTALEKFCDTVFGVDKENLESIRAQLEKLRSERKTKK